MESSLVLSQGKDNDLDKIEFSKGKDIKTFIVNDRIKISLGLFDIQKKENI